MTQSPALLDALSKFRTAVAAARFPLEEGSAAPARTLQRQLVDQLDDYVLPRLRALDAPLLAVVGGSTGAGKSTLVNSVLGREVTPSGVLRPTTRAPVLVHAPDDTRWFADQRILPGLSRTTGGTAASGLQLMAATELTPGLAVLDAPDIDSVVTENRQLAGELLAAADLWLFVTTAARYADAVPWELLREASLRSAAVAIVLDRVPPEATVDVTAHLTDMLRAHALGEAPLFVIPETDTVEGLLPAEVVEPIRSWLNSLAVDAPARAAVVRKTLDGVLDSFRPRVATLAGAVRDQQAAAHRLRDAADTAYSDGVKSIDAAMRDGSLLRGEVLARWQEFVGTGELLRNLESRLGRLRDRVTAAVTGRPRPEEQLESALETGVEALLRGEADRAAERTADQWRAEASGRALLEAAAGAKTDQGTPPPPTTKMRLDRSSPGFSDAAAQLVRDWQGGVLDLVRQQGQSKRKSARFMSYGVNAAGLVVMVAVFASTGGLTGAEVAVAGGTSVLSQKVLEALLGDQAVRELASAARKDLRRRVQELFDSERSRYTGLVQSGSSGIEPAELENVAGTVEKAR